MADSQPLHKSDKPPRRSNKKTCTGYGCFKCLVVFYAFIFFLIGILLFCLGIAIAVLKKQYESINDVVSSPAILATVVGIVMIVTGLIGLIGAVREKLVLLKIFLAFIIIVFILQVIIGIIAFVYREKTAKIATKQLEFAVVHYHENSDLARAVDAIQRKHDCCGLGEGPKDWEKNANYSCSSDSYTACSVPDSCCNDEKEKPDCGLKVRRNPSQYKRKGINERGCSILFLIWVEEHLDYVGAIALGFSIPQILGIFLVYVFIQKVEDRIFLFNYSKHMQQNAHS